MSVLDVGCGTGAITRGIAEAVGPTGTVVGVDRDEALLAQAAARCKDLPNVRFEAGDATRLGFDAAFDVVTAARTLQWIADVGGALRQMVAAVRPGGCVVVLDFTHVANVWEPAPPPTFQAFYLNFLAWRASNGWDNRLGVRLGRLFTEAGLVEVSSEAHDDTTTRGEPDFAEKTALWTEVMDSLGPVLERAEACDPTLLASARRDYEAWRTAKLSRHTLAMSAVLGQRPR